MLALDEGAVLVNTARSAFFQHLSGRSTSDPSGLPSKLQQKLGAYVRIGMFAEHNQQDLILGFTGYPIAQKSVYESVRDASIAIASRTLKVPLNGSELWFEVTILSHPQSLKTLRLANIASVIEFGRDAVMISSGLAKAIILPQTAIMRCRDQIEVLAECCRAVGLPENAWVSSPVTDLLRFHTQIFREAGSRGRVHEVSLAKERSN
jgi:uncharacterized protein (TIGR00296 family)